MRYPRSLVSICSIFWSTLYLGLLCSSQSLANPVLADERSVSNGAELYDLYCSSCHGVDLSAINDEFAAPGGSDELMDYAELIDIALGETQSQAEAVREENQWPDWVEAADLEGAAGEPDIRTEVLEDVTSVIDEAYGVTPGDYESGWAADDDSFLDVDPEEIFDPNPGVTNLADPTAYFYGITEEEMFNSIAKGTGVSMPGWRVELGSDESVWDLVNYIRSFWGEEWLY